MAKCLFKIDQIITQIMSFDPNFSSKKRNKKEHNFPTQYRCENCGTQVSINGDIPRCLGCGKALCTVCNTYRLCPQDYHRLNSKDQKKIKKYQTSIESAKTAKKIFTIMPIILATIGMVLLILMIIIHDDEFYFLFGFLGGFLLFSGLLFFFFFRGIEAKETKRYNGKIKEILVTYKIFPENKQTSMTKDSHSLEIIYCPACGEPISDKSMAKCKVCGFLL